MTFSIVITPWGPPNPRKAVFGGKFVRQTVPVISAFGIQYALSMCVMARAMTAVERSAYAPPSE